MVMDWGGREPPAATAAVGLLKAEDPGEFIDLSCIGPGGPSSPADSEIFSDINLSYINEMLMEEQMGDRLSFACAPIFFDPFLTGEGDGGGLPSSDGSAHRCPDWTSWPPSPPPPPPPPEGAIQLNFQLSDGIKLVQEYQRGVEEASKFLPPPKVLELDEEKKSSRAREDGEEETDMRRRRSRRLAPMAAAVEEIEEIFDRVLLCSHECTEDVSVLKRAPQSEVNRAARTKSKAAAGRGRAEEEVVDLRTLLVKCAQAVAADDQQAARELLKQVRAHGSATGDGSQRLAICLADGLEARLVGTGTRIYQTLLARTQSAAALLKAYHLFLAACPFKKISYFFANQTILDAAAGRRRLHIIDFGVYVGFQWPCLIQRLSMRPGGPPTVRMTGVELPQPGFRPADRVADTGRRLKRYADMFNVPFEYRPVVTARWEDITAADLGISSDDDDDEVLAVNCLYRLRNVVDDVAAGVGEASTREKVLRRIAGLRPQVFVHGVVNGAYGAPFFMTRFREALFHFSALFDMLDATVPREDPERMLIEREIFGKEAMNVVACEGAERVERPETYRQWQARNVRAGLVQLPLDGGILRKAREKVATSYDKDFLIGEDGGWLLQGWKGRIIYAVSTWRPSSPPSPFKS